MLFYFFLCTFFISTRVIAQDGIFINVYNILKNSCSFSCSIIGKQFTGEYTHIPLHLRSTDQPPQAFFQCHCFSDQILDEQAQLSSVNDARFDWVLVVINEELDAACKNKLGENYQGIFSFKELRPPLYLFYLCHRGKARQKKHQENYHTSLVQTPIKQHRPGQEAALIDVALSDVVPLHSPKNS